MKMPVHTSEVGMKLCTLSHRCSCKYIGRWLLGKSLLVHTYELCMQFHAQLKNYTPGNETSHPGEKNSMKNRPLFFMQVRVRLARLVGPHVRRAGRVRRCIRVQGSILQNSFWAENFLDKFSPENLGQSFT
jgi:hypothetical protein